MKKISIAIMAVAMGFASCQKNNLGVENPEGDRAVAFSAESISQLTKVSGSEWEMGDAIGIVVHSSNDELLYDNVKYVASGSGAKVSFAPDSETIYYPKDDAALSFMALYPYQDEWSYTNENLVIDLSVQDGTEEAQEKVDLLQSTIEDQTEGEQVFQFDHQLSKVQITVNNYVGELPSAFDNFENLTVSFETNNWQYNPILKRAISSSELREVEMVKTLDGTKAIFTVIVPSFMEDLSEEITFTDGVSKYVATLAIDRTVVGKKYNFTTTIGKTDYMIVTLEADDVTDWDAQGDSALDKDMGIVGDIYEIYTIEGLRIFANMVSAGDNAINGKLMNDIDLEGSESNQWMPIGSEEIPFKGTFDGNGFEITGLYINNEEVNQGFFGCTVNATIENLGVRGSVTGEANVGGIVGNMGIKDEGAAFITNCYNACTVSASDCHVGGIAGMSFATLSKSYNTGKIKGGNYAAGLVGMNLSPVVDSYNTGEISGGHHIAGIVAMAVTNGVVTNCYNEGAEVFGEGNYVGGIIAEISASQVISNCYNKAVIVGDGSNYVAGIVGNAVGGSSITNCHNENEIVGYGKFVGGIVGFASGATSNCYNTADVFGYGFVGGIAGQNVTSMINCYNIGKSVFSQGDNIGGIVGQFVGTESALTSCYNWADVDGGDCVGGVAGLSLSTTIAYNAGEVVGSGEKVGGVIGESIYSATYCYYDNEKYTGSGIGVGEGEESGFSTAEMKSKRLLYHLNNAAFVFNEADPTVKVYAWEMEENSYPVFDTENEPVFTDFDITYNTQSEKYQIYTTNGLKAFADLVNGSGQSVEDLLCDNSAAEIARYFNFTSGVASASGELMADIDLDGNSENQWIPIGTGRDYIGTFNGNGYVVSGLFINDDEINTQALFGSVKDATIENLNVEGKVTAYKHVGGIVAIAKGRTTIRNCENRAVLNVKYGGYCGGIAAECIGYDSSNAVLIEYCSNVANISNSTSNTGVYIGGIAGKAKGTTIRQCSNVNLKYRGDYWGYEYDGYGIKVYGDHAGGIVGHITSDRYVSSLVENCYNNSWIGFLRGNNCGGIVGYAKGDTKPTTIRYCYNAAPITLRDDNYCYYAFGVVGYRVNANAEYCFFDMLNGDDRNEVTRPIGNYESSTCDYMYNSEMTAPASEEGSLLGIFEEQGVTCWTIDPEKNNGYPILKWQIQE